MKKIYLSILSIVATVGIVSGAAYALFSDTVTVSGLTVSTGNADLYVYDSGTSIPLTDTNFVNELNTKLSNLYPGFRDYTIMRFENKSSSAIKLSLSAQLKSISGSWNTLKDKIYLVIKDSGSMTDFPTTGWKTLEEWYNSPVSFGDPLEKGVDKEYRLFIKVKTDAGNEISGLSLTGNLEFTGTQVQ